MYNDDDLSGGFNNAGAPYQFLNQAAVTNAVACGQNVDWAQLAQQWIQMRDNTTTVATVATVATGVTDFSSKSCGNIAVPLTSKYEEKGEADMDMDDEEQVEERTTTVDRSRRNQLSTVMQHQPSSVARQWSTQNNDSRVEVGSQKSNNWANNQSVLPSTCDNQIGHRQTNSTAHIPSLLSMNVPHPNDIRALPDTSSEPNSQQGVMDAAKRKALPAWIREGLEKMEREKQKQQELYAGDEEYEDIESSSPDRSRSQVATENILILDQTDDEEEDTVEASTCGQGTPIVNATATSVDSGGYKNYEQKLSELMIVVRHTLTELLLEVTNEEISKVANETLKSQKLKASSAQVIHKSALSSITNKLGLAAYDDSSSGQSSDEEIDETSPVRKTLPLESGNDSEEELKNSVREKRRAFAKIASEIEERVAAAASKEEEKLKYFSNKEEASTSGERSKSIERNLGTHQKEAHVKDSTNVAAGSSGNLFDRDTGETTETKLQTLNGKLHKERGARKERTTRFSDNKDNKYLAIATSASFIRDLQSKDVASTPSLDPISATQLGKSTHKSTPVANTIGANVKAATKVYLKRKTSSSPEKDVDRDRDKKQTYLKKPKRRRASQDSTSDSETCSSSTSSSSSSSSDSESSTTNSSDNSRYSTKSHRKYPSQATISEKSKQSHRDKRDDRKYHSSCADEDRDSHHSRYRSERSRSRSRHRRRRHGSHDSDKNRNRRKHDSRYSSSHSRSRNSSHRHHDYSTSNSRTSYSSSSSRRR